MSISKNPEVGETKHEQPALRREATALDDRYGEIGILAVAVLVLLVLFALFRGRDSTTVVKETYTATPPVTRSSGIGTDERNINSRAASGPGTNSGGMNDPNARR